jgi:transposase-like protein
MTGAQLIFVEESVLDNIKPRHQRKNGPKRPYNRYTKEQQFEVLAEAIANPKTSLAKIARKHGVSVRMTQKWMASLIKTDTTPTRPPPVAMKSMLSAFSMDGNCVEIDSDDRRYRMGLDATQLTKKLKATRPLPPGRNGDHKEILQGIADQDGRHRTNEDADMLAIKLQTLRVSLTGCNDSAYTVQQVTQKLADMMIIDVDTVAQIKKL